MLTDEVEVKELTEAEREAELIKRVLPRLINDVAVLVCRPFRFIWDASVGTASTDCLAEIRVSPRPFIEGETDVGFGTVYHETGHIRFSPYGGKLMIRASKEGDSTLSNLVNIILDRKDDVLTAEHAPGFADTLKKRLLVIRTLARREQYKNSLAHMSLTDQSRFLRNAKPRNAYEDFFFAAKCGKAPRLPATKRAMKYVRVASLIKASPDELLWRAKKVRQILGEDVNKKDRAEAENDFELLILAAGQVGFGDGPSGKISTEVKQAIENVIAAILASGRARGIKALLSRLATHGITYPGPISVGLQNKVPIEEMPPNAKYEVAYTAFLAASRHLVDPLVKALREISTPSEFELYGRDEGEIDFSEVGRIACNLPGFYQETVVERDIDAEIGLAIDSSGSMGGQKIEKAKMIATLFTEAVLSLGDACRGRIWSFNSSKIYDYGLVSRQSGFVTARGAAGNSDTHLLKLAGTTLLKSTKKRKLLFVLCDDGPDDIEEVKKVTEQLMARGLIVVHLLVDVHGTPDIYPVELVYSSIDECLREFGDLLKTIFLNIK